jgi:hypothetical protein
VRQCHGIFNYSSPMLIEHEIGQALSRLTVHETPKPTSEHPAVCAAHYVFRAASDSQTQLSVNSDSQAMDVDSDDSDDDLYGSPVSSVSTFLIGLFSC